MLKLKSDLHLHTSDDRSDHIKHTAKELIDLAASRDFRVLSITNHDTFTFNHDLESYARDQGIILIPGIEKKIEGKHVLILKCKSDYRKNQNVRGSAKSKSGRSLYSRSSSIFQDSSLPREKAFKKYRTL